MKWHPIQDLPSDWSKMVDEQLNVLQQVWKDQSDELQEIGAYKNFLSKLNRKMAIETGIIERLYTLDRGITLILIENGIDEALIQHGSTDRPVSEVVSLIRDQERAIEGLFSFVKGQRQLSTSYIRELHQVLTEHQEFVDAVDNTGQPIKARLVKGDWKKFSNNPTRPDGTIHQYAPPEQVSSEIDKLIEWHRSHLEQGVSPEVEAAWLHHRFTQIHPFQDGNGRVARLLASLVFIRAGWFPLVVTRDERTDYIRALEEADQGDLSSLVNIFARAQIRAFRGALSLSEQAISERENVQSIVQSVLYKLRLERAKEAELEKNVEQYASILHKLAIERLEEVASEIRTALKGETRSLNVNVRYPLDEEQLGWYRYQTIAVAKKLDYFANLSGFKTWAVLRIELNGLRTEILISFHHTGREIRGLMAASACAYHRVPSEEFELSLAQDIEVLTVEPFDFSYLDDSTKLRARFRAWLEEVVVAGLEYWRKGI